jgi:hypothetical protein
LSLCAALFSALPVVKSGDHAGQTPFEIIISLNTSKYDDCGGDVCVCVCVGAHVCVCVYFVAPQIEEAVSRYGEVAQNIFDKQPQTANKQWSSCLGVG